MYRCASCATLHLLPRPERSEIPAFYRDYYTHEVAAGDENDGLSRITHALYRWLDAMPFAVSRLRRSARHGYLDRAPDVRPGGLALDIGCGDGTGVRALGTLGHQAMGVDVDFEALGSVDGRAVQADGEVLPFASNSVTVVLLAHVIEHAVDPSALLREVARILEPGGLCSVLTPNSQSLLADRWGPHWRGLEPPRHLQVFSLDGLARLIEIEPGLRVERAFTTERLGFEIEASSRQARTGRRHGSRWRSIPIKVLSIAKGIALERRERRMISRGAHIGEEIVLHLRKVVSIPNPTGARGSF